MKTQQAEVISISEAVTDNLIKKVEDAITEITIKREEIASELAQKKHDYEQIKAKDDAFIAQMDTEKKTLDTLIHWKTNTNPNKKIKVHKSISNSSPTAHKKSRGGGIKIGWVKLIVAMLDKEKKFTSLDRIFDAVLRANPDLPKIGDEGIKKAKYYIKYKVGDTIKDIVMYNDKFGLPYWMDGDTIKAEHLNDFI